MICYASICCVRYVQNMYKHTSVSALVSLHQLQNLYKYQGLRGRMWRVNFKWPCTSALRLTLIVASTVPGTHVWKILEVWFFFAKHCFSGVLEGIALFLQSYSIECLSLERFILKPLLTFGWVSVWLALWLLLEANPTQIWTFLSSTCSWDSPPSLRMHAKTSN